MIMTKEILHGLPSNSCVEGIILRKYPELYNDYKVLELKRHHMPHNKGFWDKPNDTGNYGIRRRTRPWDNCWFSNKPHIIKLTVEQALNQYPDYILWCYKKLNIEWSTHTIKLIEAKLKPVVPSYDDEFED
jgi:hypothetical protein